MITKKFLKLNNLGLSNDLYLYKNKYFIKKSRDVNKAFLDFNNQKKIVKYIKNEPYTLPIISIKGKKTLTTKMLYYKEVNNFIEEKKSEKTIIEISKLISYVHKTKINKKIKIWNPIDEFNLYKNLIDHHNNSLAAIETELKKWLENYKPKKLVLCHNDLNSNNIIKFEEKWYIIDWDFACLNDSLFDIASFISESLIYKNNINCFIKQFNLTNDDIANVKKWIIYQNYIWYHWAIFLFKKTNDQNFKDIANIKLNNLLKNKTF